MNEQLQLEDLLRELHGEGEMESSGAFTMDLEKAAPKLRKFLLQNPFHYALKMIQAGVAGGARKIVISSGDKDVYIQLEGARFECAQLQRLFHFLLEAQADRDNRAVRHLAIGINGVVSLGASRIVLQNWDGVKGYRNEWNAGGQKTSEFQLQGKVEPHLRLEVVRSSRDRAEGVWKKLNRDFGAMVTGRRSSMDREEACVFDRAYVCPVPLVLNGKTVNRPYICRALRQRDKKWTGRFGEMDLAAMKVVPTPGPISGLRFPDYSKTTRPRLEWDMRQPEVPSDSPCEALMLLDHEWGAQSHLMVLEDGVLLAQQLLFLGRPGLSVLHCGSLYQKDLTGLTVTRENHFLTNLAVLAICADTMRQCVTERWPTLPADLRQSMATKGMNIDQLSRPLVERVLELDLTR